MDDLNNKLNSNNPIVICQIISKLVEAITKKKNDEKQELPELKFLYEKCMNIDPAISNVASQGIIKLVENGILQTESTIAHIMAVTTTTKTVPHVSFVINNLMIIEMQQELAKTNQYKCPYNLRLPQHPFIIILKENSNFWRNIFNEIKCTYKQENLTLFCNELYKPLYLYTMCNPNETNLCSFKQRLWSFLLQTNKSDQTTNIINSLLCWMQFHSIESIEVNSDFLNELTKTSLKKKTKNICDIELVLLWQISVLYHLILNKFDPRDIIASIREIIENSKDLKVLTCVLLILTKSIVICSSVYLKDLLNLCNLIIRQKQFNSIILLSIKSSVLQWIANPSILVSDANVIANEIYVFIENNQSNKSRNYKEIIEFSKKYQKFMNTNNDVHISIQLSILSESWENNEQILSWLQTIKDTSQFFIYKIIHFLYGIFLKHFNDNNQINLIAFEVILNCALIYKKIMPNVLTLILYKLSNSFDFNLHFQLLKALPKLVVMRENYQKITITIQALSEGPNVLKIFGTSLMFDVWKIDEKCYTLLENLLVAPYDGTCSKWEFYSARANIFKEISALKPEVYGKEMVAHLSKILNECNDIEGSLPCALALEGITSLCKFEIIDAITTWNGLKPLFENEKRIPVVQSLCLFISEIPSLSYAEAYHKFLQEIIAKLWEYIMQAKEPEIIKAALNALTAFSLEQIFEHFPEIYLCDSGLSGNYWMQFLKNCDDNIVPLVGDFMIQMVSIEISNYLKHIYQVKGPREPTHYTYLPGNSLVRAIGFYIKAEIRKWKNNTKQLQYLECLRIFSVEYSKPLPPLDWCFLQELFHEPQAKNYCISIAAHQVMLSGTARRFMENYIVAITQSGNVNGDVIHVYKQLKHLANSIQPALLKPFFENTIDTAVKSFENGDEETLLTIVSYLIETLRNLDIQDINKISIAQVLNKILCEVDESSKLFEVLIDCIILFPTKYLNDLSSPKSVKEVTLEWYKQALKIKCNLAINTNNSPLNCLNELIEIGSMFHSIKQYIFDQFVRVFKKHKDNTENALWLLDLIGQIQVTVTEKYDEKQVAFLCDTLIFAVLVFSGYFVFDQEIYELFPQALATLLDINHWSICTMQMLEWLYHMNFANSVSNKYKNLFGQCLQALRYEDEFKKNIKWMKYLNCNVNVD